MAERWISVYFENAEEAQAWLSTEFGVRSRKLREFVEDVGGYATAWMRLYVPVDSGYTYAHIHQTPSHWRAGGYGGGGSWEVTTGIRRGTSQHPLFVHGGTGIYAGRDPIRPRHDRAAGVRVIETRRPRARWQDMDENPNRRPTLTFQKRGEPRRFRTWVRGQRPQPFMYLSFQQAQIRARTRVRSVIRGI